MKQTVKYQLNFNNVQMVDLPEGSTVLTGMIKENQLTIWVSEESTAPKSLREFKFFETKDAGFAADYHYVCTVFQGDILKNLFLKK
jgi:hypothetical protein